MNEHEGIIIKTINYSDSSKILYLLTPYGMQSLLAKGAKKIKSPIRHLTQTITKISFNKSKSANLPVLINGDILNDYSNIKQDLEMQTYASHIFELVYKMSNEMDYQRLYDFVSKVLDEFITTKDPEFMTFVFELKYLYLMGLAPVFSRCVECDSDERVGFDVYKGGMVCNNHVSRYTVKDNDVVLSIYKLYQYQYGGLFDIDRRQIRLIIDQYYEHYLNYRSKSRDLLNNIIGY